jgi:ABC-2 type transport system permease protein
MKALSIAWKDLQILVKDRGVILQLFVLPLLFVLVLSGALGQVGKAKPDTRIPLAVVNLDGGDSALNLIESVDKAGGVRVERYEEAEAMALLKEYDIPRVLIVPQGFSDALAAGTEPSTFGVGPETLRLISHPEADSRETGAVRLVIDGVAADATLGIQMMAALKQMGDMQAASPGASEAFSAARMQAQALGQFAQAEAQPLVSISQRQPGQSTSSEVGEEMGLSDVAVPGITVLFIFYTAGTVARSIYEEKKIGSFRRLLAAPVGKGSLLLGKMIPNFLVGLVQGAVIFAFGLWGLRLLGLTPVSIGQAPLAMALVLVLVALCSSAFGLIIAALAHTEGQIGGLSTLILWIMALIGGSLIPLFLLEKFLGPLPKIVPHYWANSALVDLMVRGAALGDVMVEMVVLLAFTALFFVIGLWRFDFD